MRYEICKVINEGEVKSYTAIAWTDVKSYAEECAEALELLNGCKYAVCVDGKPCSKPDMIDWIDMIGMDTMQTIVKGTKSIKEYQEKQQLAKLAKSAYLRHRQDFDTWNEGEPVKAWYDSENNLCVEYESGKFWHYKDLDLPFPTWW